jgi:prophage regulatory protein|tara:strand:+ start:817 stop:1077 length:261 start_codon:yes stop_codon:yes gene_type:complete
MTSTKQYFQPSKHGLQSNDRFVREQECREITGLSRQHRWELEKTASFPKRVKLGSRTIAWRLSELQEWINNTSNSREAQGEHHEKA